MLYRITLYHRPRGRRAAAPGLRPHGPHGVAGRRGVLFIIIIITIIVVIIMISNSSSM